MRIEGRLISAEEERHIDPNGGDIHPEVTIRMSVTSITDLDPESVDKEFTLLPAEELDDSPRIKKLKAQMVELRKELGRARSEASSLRVEVNLREAEIAEWEQRYAQEEAERYSEFDGAGSW